MAFWVLPAAATGLIFTGLSVWRGRQGSPGTAAYGMYIDPKDTNVFQLGGKWGIFDREFFGDIDKVTQNGATAASIAFEGPSNEDGTAVDQIGGGERLRSINQTNKVAAGDVQDKLTYNKTLSKEYLKVGGIGLATAALASGLALIPGIGMIASGLTMVAGAGAAGITLATGESNNQAALLHIKQVFRSGKGLNVGKAFIGQLFSQTGGQYAKLRERFLNGEVLNNPDLALNVGSLIHRSLVAAKNAAVESAPNELFKLFARVKGNFELLKFSIPYNFSRSAGQGFEDFKRAPTDQARELTTV